jgi:hypothetical protein
MIPRCADVRRTLKRYPDVTCAERRALWSWYRQARAVELVAALSDPSLEPSLARLQRDYPTAAWPTAISLSVIVAAIAFTFFTALV